MNSKNYHDIFFKQDPETIFPLFRVSYHWIAPLGLITTLLVGMVVGYFFDKPSSLKMDAELFTPVMWRWLPSEARDKAGDTRRARASLDAATPHSAPLILATVDKVIQVNK